MVTWTLSTCTMRPNYPGTYLLQLHSNKGRYSGIRLLWTPRGHAKVSVERGSNVTQKIQWNSFPQQNLKVHLRLHFFKGMKNIVRRFITQNADPNLVNTVSLLFCDVIAAVPVCIEPVPYASFISGSLLFCQIVWATVVLLDFSNSLNL